MEAYRPEDYPNDYSNPNAVAGEFSWIREQLAEIDKDRKKTSRFARADDIWKIGIPLAMVLSWSRNSSVLYCVGHGIASWLYVIYFAWTR
jgi:hypothetical protein